MSRANFYRLVALAAVLILGFLAWYGLHQDISKAANPCATRPASRACVFYACNIGHILGLAESSRCGDARAREARR